MIGPIRRIYLRISPEASFPLLSKPLSVTKNDVGLQSAAASHVEDNSSAQAVRSGRSRTNAVICN